MSRSTSLIFIVSAFHSTINTNNHGTVHFFFFNSFMKKPVLFLPHNLVSVEEEEEE